MTMNRTNRLAAMRRPGESYSDVILRIAKQETPFFADLSRGRS
jgi:hypothetical protein